MELCIFQHLATHHHLYEISRPPKKPDSQTSSVDPVASQVCRVESEKKTDVVSLDCENFPMKTQLFGVRSNGQWVTMICLETISKVQVP